MGFNLSHARDFVKTVNLRGIATTGAIAMDAAADAAPVFDQAKNQALTVGSGLFSFAQGVTEEVRKAISESALLAQLAANNETAFEDDPNKWLAKYSEVLQTVGWTVQKSQTTEYKARGTLVEVHEKILEALTAALVGTPAAITIITATINALKAMDSNSPWFKIFNREAKHAKIARFQVGFVDTKPDSDLFVSLAGCIIKADSQLVQVLFFKFGDNKTSLKVSTSEVSVDRQSVTDIEPEIRKRVRDYQRNYMSKVLDIPLAQARTGGGTK